MICENCNKREAVLNLSKIMDGESTSIWLCEKCAKEYGKTMFTDIDEEKDEYVSFNNVLSILFDDVNKKNEKLKTECPSCGTKISEIEKGKLLGCGECYKIFYKEIDEIVEKDNMYNEHKGCVPSRLGKEIEIKREIKQLEKEMEIAIAIEAYEKAAVIRDKIKKLKDNYSNTIEEEK